MTKHILAQLSENYFSVDFCLYPVSHAYCSEFINIVGLQLLFHPFHRRNVLVKTFVKLVIIDCTKINKCCECV